MPSADLLKLNEENLQLMEELLTMKEADASTQDYEALGFAVCARETLLFLQREGVDPDSLLYRTLRKRLLGQTSEEVVKEERD